MTPTTPTTPLTYGWTWFHFIYIRGG